MSGPGALRVVEADFTRLFVGFPYIRLNQPRSSLNILRRHARSLEIWGHYLPHYRSLRCEPLDLSYRWLTWLAVANDELCEDLCQLSWRGKAIAAWLTIMLPSASRRACLERAAQTMSHPFSANLALNVIDGVRPADLVEHVELIDCIRTRLTSVPLPKIKLRQQRPELMEEVRRELHRIYRAHGSAQAVSYLREVAARTLLPVAEHTAPTIITDLAPSERQSWAWSFTD